LASFSSTVHAFSVTSNSGTAACLNAVDSKWTLLGRSDARKIWRASAEALEGLRVG
jgi:hypothetical protein